jgi:hypothetical protein
MQVVDGQCDLCEPIKYLSLCEVFPLFLHLLDAGVHVAELAVDHDDAEVAFLVGEGILVGDDIDMSQFLQYLQLVVDILPFLLIDLKDLDAFEGVVVTPVGDVLAQEDVAR